MAVIEDGRVLAARRSAPAELAGGWELPGGKVEPGEDVSAAAIREIGEELGCVVVVTGTLSGAVPVTESLELVAVTASLTSGDPVPTEHDAIRWLAADQLDEVAWLDADLPFVAQLEPLLRSEETR